MFNQFQRRLNNADRTLLDRRGHALEVRVREQTIDWWIAVGVAVFCGLLALYILRPVRPWTLVVSILLTIPWAVWGGPFGIRSTVRVVDGPVLQQRRRELDELRAVVTGGQLHVTGIEAGAVVVITDAEDEVDLYAFQVDPERILILEGWLEDEPGFPSTSFEIVGLNADFDDHLGIHLLGKRLTPDRRVCLPTARDKAPVEGPWLLDGRLADLERLLS